MENKGHATTGFAAGAATLATWCQITAPHTGTELAALWTSGLALSVGAALLPDIDHHNTVMTRSFGPVTGLLSGAARNLSGSVYHHTRRHCDPPPDKAPNTHRGLIHTWQFALSCGAAAGLASYATQWALPALLLLLAAPAVYALRTHKNRREAIIAAAALAATNAATVAIAPVPPLLVAITVTVGMLTHNAGDGCTKHGIPWKALVPHRCDTHRSRYLNRACDRHIPLTRIALVRWRWHHCPDCEAARRSRAGARCCMWDRNTNIPEKLVFTTGQGRSEQVITVLSALAGIATVATSLAASLA